MREGYTMGKVNRCVQMKAAVPDGLGGLSHLCDGPSVRNDRRRGKTCSLQPLKVAIRADYGALLSCPKVNSRQAKYLMDLSMIFSFLSFLPRSIGGST